LGISFWPSGPTIRIFVVVRKRVDSFNAKNYGIRDAKRLIQNLSKANAEK